MEIQPAEDQAEKFEILERKIVQDTEQNKNQEDILFTPTRPSENTEDTSSNSQTTVPETKSPCNDFNPLDPESIKEFDQLAYRTPRLHNTSQDTSLISAPSESECDVSSTLLPWVTSHTTSSRL